MDSASAIFTFLSKAALTAVEIGLSKSLVLFTFPKPTLDALIPFAIFSSVTARFFILLVVIASVEIIGLSDEEPVPAKSPAN